MTTTLVDLCAEFEIILRKHQRDDAELGKLLEERQFLLVKLDDLSVDLHLMRKKLAIRSDTAYKRYKCEIENGKRNAEECEEEMKGKKSNFIKKYIYPVKTDVYQNQELLAKNNRQSTQLEIKLKKSLSNIELYKEAIKKHDIDPEKHTITTEHAVNHSSTCDNEVIIEDVSDDDKETAVVASLFTLSTTTIDSNTQNVNKKMKTKIKQTIVDNEQYLYDQLSELVFVDNPQDRSSLLKKTIQIVREVRQLGGLVTPMLIKSR